MVIIPKEINSYDITHIYGGGFFCFVLILLLLYMSYISMKYTINNNRLLQNIEYHYLDEESE